MLSLAIRDRVVLVAERLDGEHRPERLVLDDGHASCRSRRAAWAGSRSRRPAPGRRAALPRTAASRPRRARGRRTPRPSSRCAAEISGPVSAFSSNGPPRRISSARRTSSSTNSSWIDSSTTSRAPAEQTWPECRNTAVSAKSRAASRSASANTMLGFLPPSSRATFFTVAAAAAMIRLPVASPPVNETRSTRGSSLSGAPGPRAGAEHEVGDARRARRPPRAAPISRIAVCGVSSLGLSTKVLPAARQGATFHAVCSSG